ncbi:integrase catalytic domain-containing protein [Trichonephila clavipes]|nr:integrase catalytic domain-containing protein [Trichonephila clavipes]
MTFLCLEVQGEEMVQLAKSGFGTPIRKRDSPTERVTPTELMTASALASSEKSSDRFRIYPVGIVANIEKAFLMLSVAPKDRDYLRFFSPCNEKQLVYRHCRVVFGVSSSPYLLNASFGKLAMWRVIFILGIIWDLDNDVLKCCTSFDSLTCEVKITKRLVLSTVQKVFDPMGMLPPFTLLPKLLLQEIWKMKIAWDQELPQNIVNKFMKWFNEVQILKDVTVPHCMKIDIFTELHVFVDASKGSYAGCVFAQSIVDSGVSVILVRAKSGVAPLKLLSIPRLELMACCIGARLVNSVHS